MSDFYEVNVEVKIRQNVGQICEAIKNKNVLSCYYGGVLLKECFLQGQFKFYSFSKKNIKRKCQKNITEVRCDIKVTKKLSRYQLSCYAINSHKSTNINLL